METTKRLTALTLFVLAFAAALIGCGGGGSRQQVAVAPPAPPPPPPASASCARPDPQKTTDTPGLPGGVWSGTLTDCADNTSKEVLALISEDGRFRIFSVQDQDSADLLSGLLEMDGNTFAGDGFYWYTDGYVCADCWATRLVVTGQVRDRASLTGRWSADWGSYGVFQLDYQRVPHTSPVPLAQLAGEWDAGSQPGGWSLSWTIASDGRFTGVDNAGCQHSGQFTFVNTRYNLYEVKLTVSGCASGGEYAGFATWSSGPFNDRLYASVNEDGPRALRLLFLSR